MGQAAIDLCVPVWGRAYVARWLDAVLPSWLSEGNLPALARDADLRVVLLTRASDFDAIAAHPLGQTLIAGFPTRVCAIDDLVAADMSAVTLTLAFTRGARLAQARGPGAVAAFLNVDFVLADGSLRALGHAVAAGGDIVLAPSLRALQEEVLTLLPSPDASGATTLPSEDLAALALDHLHPTAAACFIDQDSLTSRDAYEFYQNAGPGLVISRSMQLFPLAVRPGAAPLFAEAYCDYGLFDLWTAGARTVVLGDSADWFALELGAAGQQASFPVSGRHDPAALAARIGIWSTAPQRAQFDHLVTIRREPATAEPPQAALARLDAFVRDVTGRLPPPLPVHDHPYWTTGRRRWQAARPRPTLPDPPEMRAGLPPPSGFGERAREAIRAVFYGQPGSRRAWHVDARIERDLADLRTMLEAADGPVLDDDRLWLSRHAGIIPHQKPCRARGQVVCLSMDERNSLARIASAAGDAERLDVILVGVPGVSRDTMLAWLKDQMPVWQVEVAAVGHSVDEARRADLEAAGRCLSTRDFGALMGIVPRILAHAIMSALAVAAGRPTPWGAGQAIWVSARRLQR